MKPTSFAYHRADRLVDALDVLAQLGDDAKVLAGGQSLVPLLALRLASPGNLVDIGQIAELAGTTFLPGSVVIGAGVTQRSAERDGALCRAVPLLAAAVPHIAHAPIRNRGTVCGSLAHGDPAAELPAVALALDAQFHLESARGSRSVAASAFFRSYLDTALRPDEVLVGVEFPTRRDRTGVSFCEVARRHGDFAVVGVAVSVSLGIDGRIADTRIALCGVGSVPVRATEAELFVGENTISTELAEEAARVATRALEPPDDVHATTAYRRHLAEVLVRRALREACANAVIGDS